MKGSHKSCFFIEAYMSLGFLGVIAVIVALIGTLTAVSVAQQTPSEHTDGVMIQGKVLSLTGNSVGDASVRLEQKDGLKPLETKTNGEGIFVFTALPIGSYSLNAEKLGQKSHSTRRPCGGPGGIEKIST